MSTNPCLCVHRADTESTSEHLEALKKLSCDLGEQRATLEDVRDQRQAIVPRLSLLDKELVKQQVELHLLVLHLVLKMRTYSNIESVLPLTRWVTWSSAGPSSNP